MDIDKVAQAAKALIASTEDMNLTREEREAAVSLAQSEFFQRHMKALEANIKQDPATHTDRA